MPEVVLEDQDFEGASATVQEDWVSGSTTEEENFTEFLGRLGAGNEETSTTIPIPRASGPDEDMLAETVTVEFVLYQIDDWTAPDDRFLVEINGAVIDLGEMDPTSTSVTLTGEDEESGITWEREPLEQGTDLGFGAEPDLSLIHI